MTYQVLARKCRPRRFEDVVGQKHVVQALSNALESDRLHHAFLFSGTRGVGKTTIARILAKCLNCESGVTSTPCGTCSSCQEIDEGRFLDLIEVDAASRTKVDETRDLLDNVQYAPTRGRYKVYLIDEVHMFSNHSFNALLKTLEEPPPHVKFLLATTDPQKLPVTVLSRCLQFHLKPLPEAQIADHMTAIAKGEGVETDADSMRLLAHAADGSIRDGLSLLDQAIAHGDGKLEAAAVSAMLGTINRDYVFNLLRALASGDASATLVAVDRITDQGAEFDRVLDELLSVLQQLAMLQMVPDAMDAESVDFMPLSELAGMLAAEDVQLFYQIALTGRRDLPLSPDPKGGFQMLMLRMLAFRPVSPGRRQQVKIESARVPATSPPIKDVAPVTTSEPVAAAVAAESAPTVTNIGDDHNEWADMIVAMQLNGMVKEMASNCLFQGFEDSMVRLLLADSHSKVRSKGVEARLQQALEKYYGKSTRLSITEGKPDTETPAMRDLRHADERQQAAKQSIAGDTNVSAICDAFDAEVDEGSVSPI